MKSKKLFAILTLCAFLMTLLPVAAFAATADYSAAASSVSGSNTSPDIYAADKDSTAKLSILFKNDSAAKVTGQQVTFYLASSRDAEQGWVDADNDGVKDDDEEELDTDLLASDEGQGIVATTDSDGKVYVRIGSEITGSFTASVWNEANADSGKQIGENVVVKVSAGDGDISDLYLADEDGDEYVDEDDVDGDDFTAEPLTQFVAGDDFDITAVLMDGNNAIEGKTVTFKKSFDDGSWQVLGSAVTDEDGEATFYYKVTKAGDYDFKATAGDSSLLLSAAIDAKTQAIADDAEVEHDTVENIAVVADDASKIVYKSDLKFATDTDEDYTLEYELQDDYGNVIKYPSTEQITFDITAAPSDSDYADYTDEDYGYTEDSDDVIEIPNINFDEIGKYTLKAKIVDTRTSISTEVEAVDFGDATALSMSLVDDEDNDIPSIYYAADDTDAADFDGFLKVKKVNKDGVSIELDPTIEDMEYATADNSVLEVENGELVVVDDEFAGTVNVTVSYTDDEDQITGTFAVPITGKPAGLKVTPVVDGKSASVTVQYVDKNGNPANAYDLDDSYTLVLPSGVSSASVDNFGEDGEASFDLNAQEYGKYNITIMTDENISKTFTVDFAAPVVVPPVIGAKTVTMFIGATGYVQDGVAKVTDVAPFIKDGRTFVAVRAIADAFGATATWNEATQTVTLTRSDRTITIVIGSPTITVVKDGVTSTVTADVPAFIVNGRTVLPFRAVAEAFGATVAYDAATGAVTFNQ